jgi:hypothetical protein
VINHSKVNLELVVKGNQYTLQAKKEFTL